MINILNSSWKHNIYGIDLYWWFELVTIESLKVFKIVQFVLQKNVGGSNLSQFSSGKSVETSLKAYYKEFKKVKKIFYKVEHWKIYNMQKLLYFLFAIRNFNFKLLKMTDINKNCYTFTPFSQVLWHTHKQNLGIVIVHD